MLLEQSQAFWQRDTGVERTQLAQLEQAAPSPHAVIISGLRRVGKSTLLAQLAHRLGQDRFYYINFEDDRFLGFGAQDANDLYQSLAETFGERKVWIVDEIQNVPGWEHFVRRFMDMGFKFYITGSNASLLSREWGSRLTGRYVPVELFPFSFNEIPQHPLKRPAYRNDVGLNPVSRRKQDYLMAWNCVVLYKVTDTFMCRVIEVLIPIFSILKRYQNRPAQEV